MVIAVLKASLERVVVNITDRSFCADPWHAKGFELQACHGARGVLGQGLVYGQIHGFSRWRNLFNAVALQNFFKKGLTWHNEPFWQLYLHEIFCILAAKKSHTTRKQANHHDVTSIFLAWKQPSDKSCPLNI